jgi:uncharacterized membrane protein
MGAEDDRIYDIIIIASLIGIVIVSILIFSAPEDQGFTELYFQDYTKVPDKGSIYFRYSIVNHENRDVEYDISFLVDGKNHRSKKILIKDNETFVEQYALALDEEAGAIQRISVEIAYLKKTQDIHFFTKKP